MRSLLFSVVAAALLCFGLIAQGADKPKPYPLKTCVVSDEKLGEMGDPYVFTYKGREVKLCCDGCKKDFDKNPEKFVQKMDAAEKAAKK